MFGSDGGNREGGPPSESPEEAMNSTTGKVVLVAALGLGGVTAGLVVAPALAVGATDQSSATAGVGNRITKIQSALSGLVSDGTLTQTQADRVATTLNEKLPARGPRGPHGHRGRPGGVRGLQTAATTLGMTVEELRTALQGGQSLADVAQSKGVSRDRLVGALVDAASKHLAEHVAAGRLTQAQADARAAELAPRISEQVDRKGLPAKPHKRERAPGQQPAPQGSARPSTQPSSS